MKDDVTKERKEDLGNSGCMMAQLAGWDGEESARHLGHRMRERAVSKKSENPPHSVPATDKIRFIPPTHKREISH